MTEAEHEWIITYRVHVSLPAEQVRASTVVRDDGFISFHSVDDLVLMVPEQEVLSVRRLNA